MSAGAAGDEVVDTLSHGAAPGREGDYLLCIEGERSWKVALPIGRELIVGRGVDAGLKVEDPLVSRHHARLAALPDGLRLEDLGSRHGTLVNGEPAAAARLLRSGDVVTIGALVLVVHRAARAPARVVLEREALARRLDEELERAREHGREVAVLVARAAAPVELVRVAPALRACLPKVASLAALGPAHVAAVVPEIDAASAARLAARVGEAFAPVAGPVALGVAGAPFDATAADDLLAAARAAADAGAPGEIRSAADGVTEIVAGPHRIVVAEPSLAKIYELAARLARSPLPILVEGETGVGKEVAAAAVHAFSGRTGAFVAVNSAAVPEALAESEWFGHARGAFTGAHTAKAGHIELAAGGTLFLDEIGELSLTLQAKLLRVLEAGEVTRVGESKPRPVDLRVVAATNRDLAAEVAAGRFRQDLFFRLGAARLVLPPLRDRPRDLAALGRRALASACAALGRAPLRLSVRAAYALAAHAWPGNVRELRNVVGYAAAAVPDDADTIELEHLPASVSAAGPVAAPAPAPAPAAPPPAPRVARGSIAPSTGFRPIADDVRDLERARMVEALRAAAGQQNRAASLIDMPLRTFATKVKRYGITAADWGDGS